MMKIFNSYKGKDKENPNYKKGQRLYRKWAFEHYPSECFICNEKNKRLYVHHINPSHEINNVENLRILCASCHRKIHCGTLSPKLCDISPPLPAGEDGIPTPTNASPNS